MVCCLYVNVSSRASETLRTSENTEAAQPMDNQNQRLSWPYFYCQPLESRPWGPFQKFLTDDSPVLYCCRSHNIKILNKQGHQSKQDLKMAMKPTTKTPLCMR